MGTRRRRFLMGSGLKVLADVFVPSDTKGTDSAGFRSTTNTNAGSASFQDHSARCYQERYRVPFEKQYHGLFVCVLLLLLSFQRFIQVLLSLVCCLG